MPWTLSGSFTHITDLVTHVPRWFADAIGEQPEHLDTELDGCPIHLRCWGDQHQPGLLLIHGGGAHSGWWDHIAPLLAASHRVVAPDLSGHGDSGVRDTYSLQTWAREVMAAAAAGGVSGRVTIVGHSMGGFVTATAAIMAPDLAGFMIIDSPLRDRPPEESRLSVSNRRTTGYATREEIESRFTAVPPQETILPYVARHVARESVREDDNGWFWKFDPAVFDSGLFSSQPPPAETLARALSEAACEKAYLRCQFGLVPRRMADHISGMLSGTGSYVELIDAGHHPMLDQPLVLTAVVRALLAAWSAR